ncbi:MAG: hypothetical protein Q4C91_01715 [Eubacteriales bacterium]|nr:hypothetical protein [Eubacteriales bacterium]
MLLQTILEGLGLGALLIVVCAIGIRKGAVAMVHLYDPKVQERCIALGLTTKEKIKRNSLRFKAICVPGYFAYVLICVYAINGAQMFWSGFWQCFVILSVMNLIDRLFIDDYWVGHTGAWVIPGTEDLTPYIKKTEKQKKWLFGTFGMAVISLILAEIGMLL